MGVTLRYSRGMDRPALELPRANSRITTSAVLHPHDRIKVADIVFEIVEVMHSLGTPDGKIAPTTYVQIVPQQEAYGGGALTEADCARLREWGFV